MPVSSWLLTPSRTHTLCMCGWGRSCRDYKSGKRGGYRGGAWDRGGVRGHHRAPCPLYALTFNRVEPLNILGVGRVPGAFSSLPVSSEEVRGIWYLGFRSDSVFNIFFFPGCFSSESFHGKKRLDLFVLLASAVW